MTVGELKRLLDNIPDDMEVVVYDEGVPSTEVYGPCVLIHKKPYKPEGYNGLAGPFPDPQPNEERYPYGAEGRSYCHIF